MGRLSSYAFTFMLGFLLTAPAQSHTNSATLTLLFQPCSRSLLSCSCDRLPSTWLTSITGCIKTAWFIHHNHHHKHNLRHHHQTSVIFILISSFYTFQNFEPCIIDWKWHHYSHYLARATDWQFSAEEWLILHVVEKTILVGENVGMRHIGLTSKKKECKRVV